MPKAGFTCPAHNQVYALLSRLDQAFLARTRCYFAGGTRIVLELGEYRESRDVDFLCSDREGYRMLREAVSETSLGAILASELSLARDVRTDQYGIRTFVELDEVRLKFEIVREARIDVEGEAVDSIPVASLTRRHCFAEKFLANADRGLDSSTLSRDVVDLAYMIEGWSRQDAVTGMEMAQMAYGDAVSRSLAAAIKKMREDRAYRKRCVDGLDISEPKILSAGLKALTRLI